MTAELAVEIMATIVLICAAVVCAAIVEGADDADCQ
jgi:dihydroxyacetone kinase DhaKLM complex PTS-EIIA-like component DhaM